MPIIIIADDTANKLPFRLGIAGGVYGYYRNDNNAFVGFKSQADIDAAVAAAKTAAMKGNAGAAQVLQSSGANNTGTKYTFTNSSSSGIAGSMVNRGALNWSGNNTTYTVPAGYYSGGTLDSRPSYNSGKANASLTCVCSTASASGDHDENYSSTTTFNWTVSQTGKALIVAGVNITSGASKGTSTKYTVYYQPPSGSARTVLSSSNTWGSHLHNYKQTTVSVEKNGRIYMVSECSGYRYNGVRQTGTADFTTMVTVAY